MVNLELFENTIERLKVKLADAETTLDAAKRVIEIDDVAKNDKQIQSEKNFWMTEVAILKQEIENLEEIRLLFKLRDFNLSDIAFFKKLKKAKLIK